MRIEIEREKKKEGKNVRESSPQGLEGELGSVGSGLSKFEKDADLLITAVSSGKGSLFDFSMAMTGDIIASFDRDTLRSQSLVIDRRTEPKAPLKGLRDTLLGDEVEVEAFLLGPKGKRERSERNEGIPELAEEEAGAEGE